MFFFAEVITQIAPKTLNALPKLCSSVEFVAEGISGEPAGTSAAAAASLVGGSSEGGLPLPCGVPGGGVPEGGGRCGVPGAERSG